VGLAQRKIEEAGISTIALSCIPDLTASVSAPRVAGVEYPPGLALGKPGDREGQMAVFRATLQTLAEISTPGEVRRLPFEWPDPPKQSRNEPPEPPPIAKHLIRHPWQLPRLLSRNPPQ